MTNYTQPHRFNIVLNSQQSALGTNTNDLYYEFNWTNIPQGKYEMSFSFLAQNNTDYVANDCPQVFLSLGCVPSVYQASNLNGSIISLFIGNLRAQSHTGTQVNFYANTNDNPNVFFNNLPTSGPIRVQVFQDDFTTPFVTSVGGLDLAEYVLVLSFQKVGDN